MTVREALENALTFLESLGYTSGDVHDDLQLVISRLNSRAPNMMGVTL